MDSSTTKTLRRETVQRRKFIPGYTSNKKNSTLPLRTKNKRAIKTKVSKKNKIRVEQNK